MKEVIELRVNEAHADLLFAADEGRRLGYGMVRLVRLDRDDPRLADVRRLQVQLRPDSAFFYGWDLVRRYTPRELTSAKLFSVHWKHMIEYSAEEAGTLIDESTACSICGAGASQRGPLLVEVRKLPKGKDFVKTLSGERLVSDRALAALRLAGVPEDCFGQVFGRGSSVPLAWQQLRDLPTTQMVHPTVAGNNPFDLDEANEHRCPRGHVIGLNLLSEVWTDGCKAGPLCETQQYVGVRRGELRPSRVLLATPAVREAVIHEGLLGWQFEVAHCG